MAAAKESSHPVALRRSDGTLVAIEHLSDIELAAVRHTMSADSGDDREAWALYDAVDQELRARAHAAAAQIAGDCGEGLPKAA